MKLKLLQPTYVNGKFQRQAAGELCLLCRGITSIRFPRSAKGSMDYYKKAARDRSLTTVH
jgi:hypothetical protein